MSRISPQISSFLVRTGGNPTSLYNMVPKSDSCGGPGDVLFFHYKGSGNRVVLLVQPVTKDPKTGNQLLTCVNISIDDYNSMDELKELYNNRQDLEEDSYRTYIMTKISGPLRRFNF